MDTMEISINDTVANPEEIVQLLNEFFHQKNIKLDVQVFDWHDAWTEFMKIGIYQHGPVVSETGDTWMGSLASRNCLRKFTKDEVNSIGGKDVFLDEMWQSCIDFDGRNIVAIPWSLDTYLIYYRRDLLAKAGVEESTAFSSLENFNRALEKLQKNGDAVPLSLTTGGKSNTIVHNASSWVWKTGGDFISPDGSKIQFTNPATLAGLKEYFSLSRYIPPIAQNLDDHGSMRIFLEGNAAVTLQNPPFLLNLQQGNWPKCSIKNIGVAVQPGVPFIGGSNLIVWNHIHPDQVKPAVELIRYLTSTEALLTISKKTALIPARLEALQHLESDPFYAPLLESFKNGRAYTRIPFWGLVEDRLLEALNGTWERVFSDPGSDLDQILHKMLHYPEERLNMTLAQ